MEKVQLNKCLSAMANGTPSKVVGVNNGAGVLTTPAEISDLAGCGTIQNVYLYTGKWYRIAVGSSGGSSNSVILNISKSFNTSIPTSQLFYINADGYSNMQNVSNIYSSKKTISKVRILYKNEPSAKTFIDIYVNITDRDSFYLAYACNIGFKFQTPVEVASTPDEGYSVKEFVL